MNVNNTCTNCLSVTLFVTSSIAVFEATIREQSMYMIKIVT